MQLVAASLFSGCGGLDLGFEDHGFDIVFACDHDQAAVDVYNKNLKNPSASCIDVTSRQFRDRIASLGNVDIILGGFPCQGFSKAGPKLESDSRNVLYRQMLFAIEACQPSMFVAENVDGLSQNYSGRFRQLIEDDFKNLGYNVESQVLDAAAFGVPQHRRRIFFVGTKEGLDFSWPVPTHSAESRNGESRISSASSLWNLRATSQLREPMTIRQAIRDITDLSNTDVFDHRVTNRWPAKYEHIFRRIGEGQKLCNVRHAQTSVYTWNIPEVFGKVTERQVCILETIAQNRRHKRYGSIPNGNPLPADEICRLSSLAGIENDLEDLVIQGYLKKKMEGYDLKGAMFCSGLFKRPLWDRPSPTVLTNFDNPRYFLHCSKNRPFTLRECARLQGFPDDFRFFSEHSLKSLLDGYRLVGNAVPPPLASCIAGSCRQALLPAAVTAGGAR